MSRANYISLIQPPTDNGGVWTCGANHHGQLGSGDNSFSDVSDSDGEGCDGVS